MVPPARARPHIQRGWQGGGYWARQRDGDHSSLVLLGLVSLFLRRCVLIVWLFVSGGGHWVDT